MRQLYKPFVIFSLNAGTALFEADILKREGFLPFKPLVGMYEGKKEKSYLFPLAGWDDIARESELARVKALAAKFNQKTVLVVYGDRSSALHPVSKAGKIKDFGVFREVSEYTAKKNSAYTYDPATGKYYVA